LLSTIQAFFEGKKELFKGLAIENLETKWEVYPVLTLSLANYRPGDESDLESIIDYQFRIWEDQYDVKIKGNNLSTRFDSIIRAAYHYTGKPVVILIDEYDNPIISTMHDAERSESHRQLLKSIYVNIKDLDGYIRFTMLTGVSRFSKMTIFAASTTLKIFRLTRPTPQSAA